MLPKDTFLHCLGQAHALDSQGLGDEASAMLREAGYWLDKAHEMAFRSHIRSSLMAAHTANATMNPGNPLFLQEIARENFLMTYGRREKSLSQHMERALEEARTIHAIQKAERMQADGEPAEASRLLLDAMRRDSLSGPLLEEFWRRAGGVPAHTGGEPLFARIGIESVDTQPALHRGFSLAVSGGWLYLAKGNGDIEVFDLGGRHLSSHSSGLSFPFSCNGPEGKAWFASGGTFACFEPESGPVVRFCLQEGPDFPQGASFTGVSYGAGILWYPYYAESAGISVGTLLGLDPATGEVRVRRDLGESIPLAAADETSSAILDALSCRAFLADEEITGIFTFDQELTASCPKHMLRTAGQILVADTTTLLLFSPQGTLLGRLRPGEATGHLTDISGIAATPDGRTLFAMDYYTNSLFRITVDIVHAPENTRGSL